MFAVLSLAIRRIAFNKDIYFKHIFSMIVSIAVIVIMQCISQSTVGRIFSDDSFLTDSHVFSVSLLNKSGETEEFQDISEDLLLPITQVRNAMWNFDASFIFSDTFDNGWADGILQDAKTEIIACTSMYVQNFLGEMKAGRPFSNTEEKLAMPSAVISSDTAELLFGTVNAVGSSIYVHTDSHGLIQVTIVGVYDETEDTTNNEEKIHTMYVSYDYLNSIFHMKNSLTNMEFISADKVDIDEIQQYMQYEFMGMYYNTDWKIAVTTSSVNDSAYNVLVRVLSILLLIFSVLAFLISNLGIMNMTLISIAKRTKEVGIRKAIGATNTDISLQIIAESMVLSVIAALLGVLSGFVIGTVITLLISLYYIDIIQNFSIYMPWTAAAYAVIATIIVSLVFSLIPAHKASKLVIVDAIRTQD